MQRSIVDRFGRYVCITFHIINGFLYVGKLLVVIKHELVENLFDIFVECGEVTCTDILAKIHQSAQVTVGKWT